MSNILEKLREQERESERRMLGKPEENPENQEDAQEEQDDLKATSTEESTGVTPSEMDTSREIASTPEDDAAEKLKSLDKRFRNYKASTDATIHELRQERQQLRSDLAATLEEVETLRDQITSPGFDLNDPFTEDDEKVVGRDALEIMRKAHRDSVEKAMKPLKEQEKLKRQQEIEALRKPVADPSKSPLERFKEELDWSIEGWAERINTPKFREFLEETDKYGATYRDRWIAAERAQSVPLIREIFDVFETRVSKKPTDKHLSPEETSGGSAPPRPSQKKKGFSKQEIAEFYQKKRSGHYNKSKELFDEGRKLERDIDSFVNSQFRR